MASCSNCETAIDGGVRFCPECATPVDADTDLLDREPVDANGETIRFGQSSRARPALLAGLFLVGLGVWALSGNELIDDQGRRPTTTASVERTSLVWDRTTPAGDRPPLLGEPVGWSIFLGGAGTLRHLDLDTGILTDHQISARPLAVSGPWLVLLEEPSRQIRAVPIDDPDAPGVVLSLDRTTGRDAAVGPDPGLVRIFEYRAGGSQWSRLVRIGDQTTLDQTRAPESSLFMQGLATADLSLVGSAAGGVFERHRDGYEKVDDASLVAVSDDVLLTQTCSQPTECDLHWLDRHTLEPVDRNLPGQAIQATSPSAPTYLSPGGRLLAFHGFAGPTVFDVARNTEFAVASDLSSIAASADGRLVALSEATGLLIYDIETGKQHKIPLETGLGGLRLQFASRR